MKHTINITISLVLLFLASQVIGLHVISQRFDVQESANNQEVIIIEADPVNQIIGPPPKIGNSWKDRFEVLMYIISGILIGTLAILVLAKFKLFKAWKVWFGVGVTIALFSALISYVRDFLDIIGITNLDFLFFTTMILAIILTVLKINTKNTWIHNFTEMFIYGGIVAFIISLFDLKSVTILLILISIYDMIAVWQSKHMIKLAEFQTAAKVFGGLFIPYDQNSHISNYANIETTNSKKSKGRLAVLGGGDIAFPLLFAGVVLLSTANPLKALIVVLGSTLTLTLLFLFSHQGKYYPAMPFISAGCFLGYLPGLLF